MNYISILTIILGGIGGLLLVNRIFSSKPNNKGERK